MFYAIPLEDRPRWSNPPWMTLLIILVNVLVFFGPQRSEERAQQAAAQFYAASALPGMLMSAPQLQRSGWSGARLARCWRVWWLHCGQAITTVAL